MRANANDVRGLRGVTGKREEPGPLKGEYNVMVSRSRLGRREAMGRFVLIGFVLLWVFGLIFFPLFGILRELVSSGLGVFFDTLSTPESFHSFYLTLLLTGGAVVVNTVFGTVLALVCARQDFKGKVFFESVIDLPFAVSPVVAGFMFILLFGPNGWLGGWFEANGIKIVYAFPGMMLATLFVTLPFVAREILPVLREFGIEQEQAAATLGAGKWQAFFLVTLPTIKWGLAYGVTLTIARSIGEFGAVLVVSGGIINKTQTATLRIHDLFSDLNYAGAFSASIVLVLASFVILGVIQYIFRKRR